MSPEITIAIVSWNTCELVERCLRSFEAEAAAGRCEVWVVDNASEDGSVQMIRDHFDWVHLLAFERNLGFGPAVNEVAKRARAEWIVPANADIELTQGALDALLAVGSDPTVGAVAPRLLIEGGGTQHSVHSFPTLRLALLSALGAYRLPGLGDRLCIEGYWDPERARSIEWAHGAFLLIRRDAFDAVGGFDPEQWMYAEDIDIHWRLNRDGWKARYEPSARVHHAVSAAAIKAFGAGRAERHLLASYSWQARRQGVVVARTCAVLNAAGAAIRWLGFGVASLLAPNRFAATRRRLHFYTRAHLKGLSGARYLRRRIGPTSDDRR